MQEKQQWTVFCRQPWQEEISTAAMKFLKAVSALKMSTPPHADTNQILAGLGTEYHIKKVAFKPYASALATHSTIQAIETIKKEDKITAKEVQHIQIEFGELPFSVVNRKNPQKMLEGKFSVYHCAALAFIKGRVTRDMFTIEALK